MFFIHLVTIKIKITEYPVQRNFIRGSWRILGKLAKIRSNLVYKLLDAEMQICVIVSCYTVLLYITAQNRLYLNVCIWYLKRYAQKSKIRALFDFSNTINHVLPHHYGCKYNHIFHEASQFSKIIKNENFVQRSSRWYLFASACQDLTF